VLAYLGSRVKGWRGGSVWAEAWQEEEWWAGTGSQAARTDHWIAPGNTLK
jgi:hypothetical protein